MYVEGQGHLVGMACRGGEQIGGGKRGEVGGFSAASRRRLLQTMARLAPEQAEYPLSLITLTYGAVFPDAEGAKRHLFTFWKRVRRWAEGVGGVWRLEFQARGAPHFHLIFYGPYVPKELIQGWWGAVIGQHRPFTRVEAVRSWKRAIAYAAKYLAKVEQAEEKRAVARPPAGGEGGDGAPPSGLDYVTYLTASKKIGRVWGVLDRRNLPWGERSEFTLDGGKWMYRWKRAARRKWGGVNAYRRCGATLFVENPVPWTRYARLCKAEEAAGGGEEESNGK